MPHTSVFCRNQSDAYLPAATAATHDEQNRAEPRAAHLGGIAKPPCVLIVDDDNDSREVIALSLEVIAGWRVLLAGDGARAFECAAQDEPDAILMDVMMPGLDGPATLQLLKAAQSTRQIPVIFLTVKSRSADRRALSDLPVEAVLLKPFDPFLLARNVAEVLGWGQERWGWMPGAF